MVGPRTGRGASATVLRQGLVLLEVETFRRKFVEGAVIIGAVALDMIRRGRAKH